MGLTPASLRQYLHLNRAAMPEPVVSRRGQETEWRIGDIFDHLLQYRPALVAEIPRLYPRSRSVACAQFVGAEIIDGMALHLWLPGDGGGPIAIAYTRGHTDKPTSVAAEVLRRLGPEYTLIAFVSLNLNDSWTGMPEVIAYEPTPARFASAFRDQEAGPAHYSARWADLAFLLGQDVPWWPHMLFAPDRVAAWRPGTEPALTLPGGGFPAASPEHLLTLAQSIQGPKASAVVERMARIASRIYCGSGGLDDINALHDRPGIIVAALPDIPDDNHAEPVGETGDHNDIDRPRDDEIDLILASEAPEAAVSGASFVLTEIGLLEPVWTETKSARLTNLGPLGQRWLRRLQPAPESHRACFGWLQLRGHVTCSEIDALQPMFDPLLPGLWIGLTDTDVHFSIGQAIAGASELTQMDLTAADYGTPFWQDTTGEVWPMPESNGNGYSVGYAGSGPRRLAAVADMLSRSGSQTLSRTDYSRNELFPETIVMLTTSPWPHLIDITRDGDTMIAAPTPGTTWGGITTPPEELQTKTATKESAPSTPQRSVWSRRQLGSKNNGR